MKAVAAVLLVGAVALVAVTAMVAEPKPLASHFRLRRARHRANGLIRGREALNATATGGTYGIDISGATCDGSAWNSDEQFKCFKDKGVSHAIVESHNGGLGNTKSIKHCTDAAHSDGIATVDLYSFWCPNCAGNTPAKSAMAEHVNGLKRQGVKYGKIWLDIETCSGCWGSAESNVQFIRDLAEGAASAGAAVGIYTNANEWAAVTGDHKGFSNFPLWYAHYDDKASFADFDAFGGWSHPYMKQFWDESTVGCFSGVDMDWRP